MGTVGCMQVSRQGRAHSVHHLPASQPTATPSRSLIGPALPQPPRTLLTHAVHPRLLF